MSSENDSGKRVRAYSPNGQPVEVSLDEMSIADRANLMPANWDHANVSVRGGHGITYARVHVHNGQGSGNTHTGTGPGALAMVVGLIILGFVLYALSA